jgi:hypothetical protein
MKPISENIGHTHWRIHNLNDRPYRSSETILEENVFNYLIAMIKETPSTPMKDPF